mgnify:CR=1 FL=1
MSDKKIHFTKMHGAGNDYIYVNTLLYDVNDPNSASIRWSDRHKGIGGDGLVLICRPTTDAADYRMRIFNADGSEAMMCGNASRCIGKYLYERGLTDKTEIKLETLSGIKTLMLHLDSEGKTVESVTVDMLEPLTENHRQYADLSGDILMAEGRRFEGTFVCMGNPHFVTFLNDIDTIDIARYGAVMERDSNFPERCNIEFAQILSDGAIRTRVWERGSGETWACGTGTCATVAALTELGICPAGQDIHVQLRGGELVIRVLPGRQLLMTGSAVTVYEGVAEV